MTEPTNAGYDMSAVMGKLAQIEATVKRLETNQERIIHELGGNGGPGIRTRLRLLEAWQVNHEKDEEDSLDWRWIVERITVPLIMAAAGGLIGYLISLL